MDGSYHADPDLFSSEDGHSAAMSGCPDASTASGGFQSFMSESEDQSHQSAGSARSAILEHREELLNRCTALRFRMESANYKLAPDMLQDMISVRERLVETGDTVLIGRLSSRLSVYISHISAQLDQDLNAIRECNKRGRTGSATSAHSAHSGSGSDVGERSLDGHDSIESKRRRFGETCSPAFEASIAQPSVKRAREGRDVADDVGGAEHKKKKPWKKATDVERQLFSQTQLAILELCALCPRVDTLAVFRCPNWTLPEHGNVNSCHGQPQRICAKIQRN